MYLNKDSTLQVQNWKRCIITVIFIVDYSAQEKKYGNGMKNGKGRKGPL